MNYSLRRKAITYLKFSNIFNNFFPIYAISGQLLIFHIAVSPQHNSEHKRGEKYTRELRI